MRFESLAVDYDGTLAMHGTAAPQTIVALEQLRATGRGVFMVTGRELDELKQIFSHLHLFHGVVAENGGLLYWPKTEAIELLHEGPPAGLVDALRARRVQPLSIGQVLIATREPYQAIVLDAIKELGLELKIVFNKGAVMVLPPGVNKATGLAAALERAGLSPRTCVAVGDAENDHAFVESCGYGVAVANAIESLKGHAAYVTKRPDGEGVVEVIELLIREELGKNPSVLDVVDSTVPEARSTKKG